MGEWPVHRQIRHPNLWLSNPKEAWPGAKTPTMNLLFCLHVQAALSPWAENPDASKCLCPTVLDDTVEAMSPSQGTVSSSPPLLALAAHSLTVLNFGSRGPQV